MSSVVVTGAGSGIGAATCRRLAAQGIDLVIHTGSRREAAEAVARECGAVRSTVITGDIADARTIDALLDAAQSLGGLGGFVANAGFADRRTLAQLDDEIVVRSLRTMVVSLAHLLRKSLPLLEQASHG